MLLLDIPLEVFEDVIAALAEKVGQQGVVQYRLVSRTFANTIKNCILSAIAHTNIANFLHDPSSARLFEKYGGEILHKFAMGRQTTRNQVVDFVRNSAKATEPDSTLYPARVMVLCMSMMALEPKYLCAYTKGVEIVNKEKRPCSLRDMMIAIAAASEDLALFEEPALTPALLLRQTHDLLPSTLKAAIVANQYMMLERILGYLLENVKGKRDCGSWKDMRNAAKKIGKALCMAVRLHKNVAGNLLFDFRDKNQLFARFAPDELGDWLVNDAIEYCNTALLYRVLEVDYPKLVAHNKDPTRTTVLMIKLWRLCTEKAGLKSGACYALQRRRYDIARVLIDNGAAIDSITPNRNTVLWMAANDGHWKDVKFLLIHGADPSLHGKDGKSAISAARLWGYSRCRFLLEA